ncbi:MAG TPA: GTPase Era [Gammaproteobacteria bacterium]|nr:GTPase Era [Gammaproteobacteria bacterium]
MHQQQGRALNRYMNKAATASLIGVDLVVWVVDATNHTDDDDWILDRIKKADLPCILVLNKIDCVQEKTQLLPKIDAYLKRYPFQEIVPISALKSENIDVLLASILERLGDGAPLFPEDQLTDKSERFLAAEIVREKLTRSLGQELPYALTVAIEQFQEEKNCLHIGAVI